jgi:hypothetical protein
MFMCAPYMTIQNLNCKYKVKLTPGNMKKGKGKNSLKNKKFILNFFFIKKSSIFIYLNKNYLIKHFFYSFSIKTNNIVFPKSKRNFTRRKENAWNYS